MASSCVLRSLLSQPLPLPPLRLVRAFSSASSPRPWRCAPQLAPPSGGILARHLHATAAAESATLAAAGVGVAVAALAARYALGVYARANPPAGGGDKATGRLEDSAAARGAGDAAAGAGSAAGGAAPGGEAMGVNTGGMFSAQSMARRFYKGGFEDKMTRREASLILGVRESAEPARIRDRHRKLLMLNHPGAQVVCVCMCVCVCVCVCVCLPAV